MYPELLADILRVVLIAAYTCISVKWLWEIHWVLGIVLAIPAYLVCMNLLGLITLPLHFFSIEASMQRKRAREGLQDADVVMQRVLGGLTEPRFWHVLLWVLSVGGVGALFVLATRFSDASDPRGIVYIFFIILAFECVGLVKEIRIRRGQWMG